MLEQLEQSGGPLEAALAWIAVQSAGIDDVELAAARRRALLVHASGGDPRRALDPDARAAAVLAAELGDPDRRAAFEAALAELEEAAAGLSEASAALSRLRADADLAWRWAACALLAEELAG